jgi:hypothetical protein
MPLYSPSPVAFALPLFAACGTASVLNKHTRTHIVLCDVAVAMDHGPGPGRCDLFVSCCDGHSRGGGHVQQIKILPICAKNTPEDSDTRDTPGTHGLIDRPATAGRICRSSAVPLTGYFIRPSAVPSYVLRFTPSSQRKPEHVAGNAPLITYWLKSPGNTPPPAPGPLSWPVATTAFHNLPSRVSYCPCSAFLAPPTRTRG